MNNTVIILPPDYGAFRTTSRRSIFWQVMVYCICLLRIAPSSRCRGAEKSRQRSVYSIYLEPFTFATAASKRSRLRAPRSSSLCLLLLGTCEVNIKASHPAHLAHERTPCVQFTASHTEALCACGRAASSTILLWYFHYFLKNN